MNLFSDLKARGLIYQSTDPSLESELNSRSMTVYAGFDPSSDSLHAGNLLALLTLKRFQEAGHRVIAIVGGATGMIGDPSGKTSERNLLDAAQIDHNVQGIKKVISRFLDFEETEKSALLLNNLDWFKNFSVIDFLRDVGKHFTVNYMVAKDSVKARLEDREQGLSFTEFSYMILQGYDFWHLNKEFGCDIQLGGSDQWGNITAGVELIRRKSAKLDQDRPSAFGMTWPLMTKSDGTKFGKSESGAVWLTSDKTSVFDFYQFFIRSTDQDVIKYLLCFTFLPTEEIERLALSVKTAPEKREAQTTLARELTRLVHGEEELKKVEASSQALYKEVEPGILSSNEFTQWIANMPSTEKKKEDLQTGLTLVDLLAETQLSSSKGQARQDIQGGGIYLNGKRVAQGSEKLSLDQLLHGQYLVLRKGKKTFHSVVFK